MESKKQVIEIDGERIHLQKSQYGTKLLDYWRVVEPIKKEDGSFNWPSILFGGYRNIVPIIVVTIFFIFLSLGIHEIFSGCNALANNPCIFSCMNQSSTSVISVMPTFR